MKKIEKNGYFNEMGNVFTQSSVPFRPPVGNRVKFSPI